MNLIARMRQRRRLRREYPVELVEASDGDATYRLLCTSKVELYRAQTLQSKEAGTVAWLKRSVQPGDVVYDIGANIGLYTLVAARLAGRSGHVYAFEPHAGNVLSLLRNVELNGLQKQVSVISSALHSADGYLDFNYHSLQPGSALSQLGGTRDDAGREFRPAIGELKHAAALDSLLEAGKVRAPRHIKLDVDGNEMDVLRGMGRLLASAATLRTMQVEISPARASAADITAFLAGVGLQLEERHDTEQGKSRLAAGDAPESVPHNLVFRRTPAK